MAKGLDLAANARLFALINMAMSDAGIATWHEKFHHNFLRPVTAIRNASALDNPAIKQDATWEPLIVTPSHPDYPSGHCANTGAGATILRKFFGTDAIQSNATYTYPILGVTRQWTNYTALVKETGNARIGAASTPALPTSTPICWAGRSPNTFSTTSCGQGELRHIGGPCWTRRVCQRWHALHVRERVPTYKMNLWAFEQLSVSLISLDNSPSAIKLGIVAVRIIPSPSPESPRMLENATRPKRPSHSSRRRRL